MGRKFKDISGKSFNNWTAMHPTEKKAIDGTYFWKWKCSCGTERVHHPNGIIKGKSKSCGCHKGSRKEKIIEYFHKSYEINENGCWIWKKNNLCNGYARFRGIENSRKSILAHRFSYVLYKGDIPEGMAVCHNCPKGDNRSCVNPDHLWVGTSLENNRDKGKKGTQCKGETLGTSILKEKDILEIKKRLLNGEEPKNISFDYSICLSLIYHIKNGRAWSHLYTEDEKEKFKNLKKHISKKLTEQDVLEIRKRYSKGDRVTDLAKEFDVTTTMICRIKNRKAWNHVP